MDKLSNLPHSERAEHRAALAAQDNRETHGAMLSLAEMLESVPPDTVLDTGNLSCLITILAIRIPLSD